MLGVRKINSENVQNVQQKPKGKKHFTVAVEGNIGSGKSTCLEYFKKLKEVDIIPEPVNRWKDVRGFNTLDMMYKDASRWSLAFQSYVQLTMAEVHRRETECRVKMIERSLHSSRNCFIENLFNGGLMPEVDYAILREWYDWMTETDDMRVDLILYLQAQPETCQSRIKSRNRHEEQGVPLDYLQSLHKLHEDWLVNEVKYKAPAPVLIINTDCDKAEMFKRFDRYRDEILLTNKEN